MNGGDRTPAWLIQVATGIANDPIYQIPLLLLGMWLWGDSTRRNQAIKACLPTPVGAWCKSSDRLGLAASATIYDRTRPRLDTSCGRFLFPQRSHNRVCQHRPELAVRWRVSTGYSRPNDRFCRCLGTGVLGSAFPAGHGRSRRGGRCGLCRHLATLANGWRHDYQPGRATVPHDLGAPDCFWMGAALAVRCQRITENDWHKKTI